MSNDGFKKISNLAYVLWQGKFDNNGDLIYLQPNMVLHSRYIDDILYWTSIDIIKGTFGEIGDYNIFEAPEYELNTFLIPKINETREFKPETWSQIDPSYKTLSVGQGFCLRLKPNEFISQSMFADDGTVIVTHKYGSKIEIMVKSDWLEIAKQEAKEAFKIVQSKNS